MARFNSFFNPKSAKNINVFEPLDYDTIVTDSTDYVPTKDLIDKFLKGERIMVPQREVYDYDKEDDVDDLPDDYTQSDDIDMADIPAIAEELRERLAKIDKLEKEFSSKDVEHKSSDGERSPQEDKGSNNK